MSRKALDLYIFSIILEIWHNRISISQNKKEKIVICVSNITERNHIKSFSRAFFLFELSFQKLHRTLHDWKNSFIKMQNCTLICYCEPTITNRYTRKWSLSVFNENCVFVLFSRKLFSNKKQTKNFSFCVNFSWKVNSWFWGHKKCNKKILNDVDFSRHFCAYL